MTKRQRVELQDQYCPYCDTNVPPADQRQGCHDERKGGCGNRLSPTNRTFEGKS